MATGGQAQTEGFDYFRWHMEEPEEKIIVYESYDTVIAANLAKTKLDAYGIPCFLSDENFVGLYPIRNEVFPGVRLHIFEKDKERVKEILEDQQPSENEALQCPACRSQKVYEERNISPLSIVLSTLFVSPFMEQKKVYRCLDCDRKFNSI